jgi:methylthioribulose-1-phosphate dehydratase
VTTIRRGTSSGFARAATKLTEVGQRFYARGWVMGTSGNFSSVVSQAPLRLAITPSAAHKGLLTPGDFLEIDGEGIVARGRAGRPSAETRLHLEIVRLRDAGAVLHTHSVWSTILSDRHASAKGIALQGFEMLKGLDGVATHTHREWVPILENDQDMVRLGAEVGDVLRDQPLVHAFLLRGHGLYTWGRTIADAERHVEILEFLLEVTGRTATAP